MYKLHMPDHQVDELFAAIAEPFEGNQRDYSWHTTNTERVIIAEDKKIAEADRIAKLRAKHY